MQTPKSLGLIAVVIAVATLTATVAGAQGENRWQWDVSTYIWASSISEDLILNGDVVGGGDTSFSDVVDLTESSCQIHLEMMGENIGFFVDAMSVDLSDQEVGQFLQTDVTITESVFDGGIIIRPAGRDGNLDLFAGMRVLSLDERYIFTLGDRDPFEVRNDQSYWDVLVAARYNLPLGERWFWNFKGDLSFGNTDGTWTVQTGAGWLFGSARRHAIFLGYRHRDLQFEKADVFDVEKTVSGPMFGVNFGF